MSAVERAVDAMDEAQQEFREDVSFHDFARAAIGAVTETMQDADVIEAAAREAFWSDDFGGHHKPGAQPHTWDNIPEAGRENYRKLIRAVFASVAKSIGDES